VHQRVAKTFQRGRAFLAGDAAHINNPLGNSLFASAECIETHMKWALL
jgi:hypothetical protein